ncbi:MAG: LysM peptidoglycan-binding domain-containing protein [Mariprofundus sp.]|nr:LysM peptidoglycan-binding domain-containing protein [Mariprofundus sp.]
MNRLKYLAMGPMFFAIGCAHSPNLTLHQQPEHKAEIAGTASVDGRGATVLKSDPLLAGLEKEDIANAKKMAQQRYQHSWNTMAQRSRFVRSRLLDALNKLNAPTSLQVIPIVESSYNPYAISHSGAIGLWQLMPATARGLGVHSNKKFDGRREIDASTVAAVGYLQQLYQRFNSWPLAFAAYNIGPNALARQLKKHAWGNSDGLNSIPIPVENRAYVQHIIGMVALLQEHSFSFPEPVKTRKVALTAPIDINRLALISGMAENDIFRFNPFLNQSQYLKTNITIHVPETRHEAIQNKRTMAGPRFIHKTVGKGDTLWNIARAHHTRVSTLKNLNKNVGKYLHIGQILKVPANRLASAGASANPLLPKNRRIRYRVRSGDSLWRIAHRFGTTPAAIARSNRISMNSTIRIGDTLWVYAKVRPS